MKEQRRVSAMGNTDLQITSRKTSRRKMRSGSLTASMVGMLLVGALAPCLVSGMPSVSVDKNSTMIPTDPSVRCSRWKQCREALLASDVDSDRFLSRYPEYPLYLKHMKEKMEVERGKELESQKNEDREKSWTLEGELDGKTDSNEEDQETSLMLRQIFDDGANGDGLVNISAVDLEDCPTQPAEGIDIDTRIQKSGLEIFCYKTWEAIAINAGADKATSSTASSDCPDPMQPPQAANSLNLNRVLQEATTVTVKAQLGFTFVSKTRQPTTIEINGLVAQTARYYNWIFNDKYPDSYNSGSSSLKYVSDAFDLTASLPVLLNFDLEVSFSTDAGAPTNAELLAFISTVDYNGDYVFYAWNSEPTISSIFSKTKTVVFAEGTKAPTASPTTASPTTASPTLPPTTVTFCQTGITKLQGGEYFCCHPECITCGGPGCGKRGGDIHDCCTSSIDRFCFGPNDTSCKNYVGPPTESPTSMPTTTLSPTTASPTTLSPTTLRPSTANPTTASPTTASPTTLPPTTAAPSTASPSTAIPATLSPSTKPPSTARPTKGRPATARPTTSNPTTARPTTAKPTTAKPTTTARPTTSRPTGPQTTPSPKTARPTTASTLAAVPATSTPNIQASPTSTLLPGTSSSTTPMRIVSGQLGFSFFSTTTVRQPTAAEINGLVAQTNAFYDTILTAEYPTSYTAGSAGLTNVGDTFDPAANFPVVLKFNLETKFSTDATGPTNTELLAFMSAADYAGDYIFYAWNSEPTISTMFSSTQMITFTEGTGAPIVVSTTPPVGVTLPNSATASPTTASPTTSSPTTLPPSTAAPSTARPTTARPTTARPTTLPPSTAAPSTARPTTSRPTVPQNTPSPSTTAPNTPFPTTASPTTSSPTTRSPTTASPTTASPTTSSPITVSPTTGRPTTLSPSTASPMTLSPATTSPTTTRPTTASPATLSPSTAGPTTATPTTSSPITANPTMASPITAKPTTASPTTANPTAMPGTPTAAPTTATPTTSSPTTTSPTTAIPTTLSPSTASPTTAIPTTASPTILPPSTAIPTTASPTATATTASPITSSPTTLSPSTAAPTTAAPTVQPGSLSASPTTATPNVTTGSPSSVPTTITPTTIEPTFEKGVGAVPTATPGTLSPFNTSVGTDFNTSATADFNTSTTADFNTSATADFNTSATADFNTSATADFNGTASADYNATHNYTSGLDKNATKEPLGLPPNATQANQTSFSNGTNSSMQDPFGTNHNSTNSTTAPTGYENVTLPLSSTNSSDEGNASETLWPGAAGDDTTPIGWEEDEGDNATAEVLSNRTFLNASQNPTPSPTLTTPSPTTLSPTSQNAEVVKVSNAWDISNSIGMTANVLISGPDRDGLDEAYAAFVSEVVGEFPNIRRELLLSQRRRLKVSFNPKTAQIYKIVDAECPSSVVAKATCQTAYGSFDLYVEEEDTASVYEAYSNATQAAIEEGRLQRTLERVDPGSSFVVERASDPEGRTLAPLAAMQEETDDSGGIGPTQIMLITAGCVVLVVAIFALATIRPNKRKEVPVEHSKDDPDALTVRLMADHSCIEFDAKKHQEEKEHYFTVLDLIHKNCPDHEGHIDALILQFKGREELLIQTLENMGQEDEELEVVEEESAKPVSNKADGKSVAFRVSQSSFGRQEPPGEAIAYAQVRANAKQDPGSQSEENEGSDIIGLIKRNTDREKSRKASKKARSDPPTRIGNMPVDVGPSDSGSATMVSGETDPTGVVVVESKSLRKSECEVIEQYWEETRSMQARSELEAKDRESHPMSKDENTGCVEENLTTSENPVEDQVLGVALVNDVQEGTVIAPSEDIDITQEVEAEPTSAEAPALADARPQESSSGELQSAEIGEQSNQAENVGTQSSASELLSTITSDEVVASAEEVNMQSEGDAVPTATSEEVVKGAGNTDRAMQVNTESEGDAESQASDNLGTLPAGHEVKDDAESAIKESLPGEPELPITLSDADDGLGLPVSGESLPPNPSAAKEGGTAKGEDTAVQIEQTPSHDEGSTTMDVTNESVIPAPSIVEENTAGQTEQTRSTDEGMVTTLSKNEAENLEATPENNAVVEDEAGSPVERTAEQTEQTQSTDEGMVTTLSKNEAEKSEPPPENNVVVEDEAGSPVGQPETKAPIPSAEVKPEVVWTKDGDKWAAQTTRINGSDDDSSSDGDDSSSDAEEEEKKGAGWIKAGKDWVENFVHEDIEEDKKPKEDSDSDSESESSSDEDIVPAPAPAPVPAPAPAPRGGFRAKAPAPAPRGSIFQAKKLQRGGLPAKSYKSKVESDSDSSSDEDSEDEKEDEESDSDGDYSVESD